MTARAARTAVIGARTESLFPGLSDGVGWGPTAGRVGGGRSGRVGATRDASGRSEGRSAALPSTLPLSLPLSLTLSALTLSALMLSALTLSALMLSLAPSGEMRRPPTMRGRWSAREGDRIECGPAVTRLTSTSLSRLLSPRNCSLGCLIRHAGCCSVLADGSPISTGTSPCTSTGNPPCTLEVARSGLHAGGRRIELDADRSQKARLGCRLGAEGGRWHA
mmetsp:Transcript_33228/g.66099  ORF Transcript_33228/g.66099 Transcript_33228/m.66099 type:complete len:221 (+) Transcript_33228:368-1030(+)